MATDVSQSKKSKVAHRDATPAEDIPNAGPPSSQPPSGPSTLASQNEVVFFERVKKQIDDRVTYHEYLKLLNMFVNDIIDTKTLVERAALFLGGDQNELFREFKALVGWSQVNVDAQGQISNPPTGMIVLDPLGVAENIPMLQRPKVDLNNQRASGPSYRKLPKSVSQEG